MGKPMGQRPDGTVPRPPAHSRYSDACWRRFSAPRHAGEPAGEVAEGRARGRAGDCEIALWLGSAPRRGGFLAHGSPWAIAAADLAVEDWLGGADGVTAASLAERLAAPPEEMDIFLTVEDAWRSACESIATN